MASQVTNVVLTRIVLLIIHDSWAAYATPPPRGRLYHEWGPRALKCISPSNAIKIDDCHTSSINIHHTKCLVYLSRPSRTDDEIDAAPRKCHLLLESQLESPLLLLTRAVILPSKRTFAETDEFGVLVFEQLLIRFLAKSVQHLCLMYVRLEFPEGD